MPKNTLNFMLVLSIIFMSILTGMEFDLFVPSFPQLQNAFQLSSSAVEMLLSANFIGFCCSLFVVGALADHYGRKPIILIGLLIFIVGSGLCLMAVNYWQLLVGRFFQGIGIAAPTILSFLIIADRTMLKTQQFFMAMLNGALNIAAGLAPVIGSYITLYFGWHGNLTVLFVMGLIALSMTLVFIPKDAPQQKQIDSSFKDYRKLFKIKPLLLLMTNIILSFIPYWIFVGTSPLLYIKSLHVSLYAFGWYQGVLAFAFALGSLGFGLVIHRCKQQRWLTIGLIIYLCAFFTVTVVALSNQADPLLITFAMLTFVVAQIIPSAILMPVCLNYLPEAKAKVSALLQAGRLVFSALILQITAHFYTGTFQTIGLIIAFLIFLIIVTQYFVITNASLQKANV